MLADMIAMSGGNHYLGLCSLLLVIYVVIQRFLRFQRVKSLQRQYASLERNLGSMTDKQAQQIHVMLAQLEFPLIYRKSLEFALFRTYGIPSISKLLVQTQQLSTGQHAPKRSVDTNVLLYEIFGNPPTNPRANQALGRLNYIHSLYRKSGKILDDDMLYTLSLFAWEPIKWMKRYEWRELTPLETCAIGTFVKSMGDAMEISYDVLPSSKTGWQDGLHWLSELGDWTENYEKRIMVPHDDNHATAECTTALLVSVLPKPLHTMARSLVISIMDERLRKAMIYDKPPHVYHLGLQTFLCLRKWFVRYVSFPRPEYSKARSISDELNGKGRYNLVAYDSFPYYISPSILNRWGPGAWIKWISGVPLPGDGGDRFIPQGYRIEEVGPRHLQGKGSEESEAFQAKLAKQRTGGCPFGMMSA